MKDLEKALQPFRDRYLTARNDWERKGIRLEVKIFKREWERKGKMFETDKVFDKTAEEVFR